VWRNQLYKWKNEIDVHKDAAFLGQAGRPKKVSNNEMTLLKAALKKLREENETLKKQPFTLRRDLTEVCFFY